MKRLEKIVIGMTVICFMGLMGINAQEIVHESTKKITVGGTPIGVPPPPPAGQVPPPPAGQVPPPPAGQVPPPPAGQVPPPPAGQVPLKG